MTLWSLCIELSIISMSAALKDVSEMLEIAKLDLDGTCLIITHLEGRLVRHNMDFNLSSRE